ncbi:hypothetical protein, partial [Phormidesmis priestleyi]|uniref:hypothetical protein n=1 Tax=Phormidesmis priestleyi TaxID=268141 RepID=UPI001E4F4D8A
FLTFLTHPSAWDNCSDLAPVYSLRFCPAREWNSGLALRSPLKRTEPQTLSQSLEWTSHR